MNQPHIEDPIAVAKEWLEKIPSELAIEVVNGCDRNGVDFCVARMRHDVAAGRQLHEREAIVAVVARLIQIDFRPFREAAKQHQQQKKNSDSGKLF